MRAQLWAAVKIFLAITLIVGVGYPLVVTGIAQVAFADKADGSLRGAGREDRRVEPHRPGVHR